VWILGPIFLTIGSFYAPAAMTVSISQQLAKGWPALSLLAVWIAVFVRLRRRGMDELQKEIDDLKALEKEIRS
jgi:hypothetical protein